MNGILLSWTSPTHLVMGSLLHPMTPMSDLPLIPILMNLGIIPKGQSKLSIFWMTLPPTIDPFFNHHGQSTCYQVNQHVVNNDTQILNAQALFWLGQCRCCPENHGTVYPMGSLHSQYLPMRKLLKSRNP